MDKRGHTDEHESVGDVVIAHMNDGGSWNEEESVPRRSTLE